MVPEDLCNGIHGAIVVSSIIISRHQRDTKYQSSVCMCVCEKHKYKLTKNNKYKNHDNDNY